MRPALAIAELQRLNDEAEKPAVTGGDEGFTSWRARVESILTRSLGGGHHIVRDFTDVQYGLMVFTTDTPDSAWDEARKRGLGTACALIDAAIYELGLRQGAGPVYQRAFDPELWEYVKGVVEAEDWGKVASQVTIFVEDRVRAWAGYPEDRNGDDLIGKGLYAAVLADGSEFRLGRRASEREGWRMLGMGFAQAISNVDRHRIQDREDARRYALGVLGLGSLLLTQFRHEHAGHVKRDARSGQ